MEGRDWKLKSRREKVEGNNARDKVEEREWKLKSGRKKVRSWASVPVGRSIVSCVKLIRMAI